LPWLPSATQLQYFRAIARAGSFTRAAAEEGISQPSISQQILSLESAMGVSLFHRRGRCVQLTQCGELLLPYADAILRLLTDARESVHAVLAGQKVRLAVGAIPAVMPCLIAGRISSFSKLRPDVDLQLVEDTATPLLERLRAEEIDVAVLNLPLKTTGLIAREIPVERLEDVNLGGLGSGPVHIGYVHRRGQLSAPMEAFIRWLKGRAAQRPRKARARSSSSALFKSDTAQ
jgi:DNA-binding transcriptional LysR family regulator